MIGILLAAFVFSWGIWSFNRIIRLRNQVRAAWSDIDVQLVRRHDLVPQLVTVVRAYAEHERALLTAVANLRTQAIKHQRPAVLAGVESELEKQLSRVFLLQEAYPNLKADQNFAQLQQDLVETEDQLQYARRFYNGAVRALNDRVLQFPDLLIAKIFSITTADFFSTTEEQQEAVNVDLGEKK